MVTMTEVGDKINEVKKKYEATVKIQVCLSIYLWCICLSICVAVCFSMLPRVPKWHGRQITYVHMCAYVDTISLINHSKPFNTSASFVLAYAIKPVLSGQCAVS